MIVTIHQPNFMPWWPFFDKMRQADMLVLLNHCQWEKGGYQNRFRLTGEWYTMGVNRGLEPICEKTYRDPAGDWGRIKRRLPQYEAELSLFDRAIGDGLAETNARIIRMAARRLGLRTAIVTDRATDKTGSERLADICALHGATTYLAGPSGKKYLQESAFRDRGIDVRYYKTPSVTPALVEVLHGSL